MTEQPDPDEARREARRQYARDYRLAHPDRVREQKEAWRDAHPERSRELNRESMRRRAEAKRIEESRHAAERERARARREANPDAAREYGRKWRQANPEKVREYGRKYADSHRSELRQRALDAHDRDPAAHAERHRAWVAKNRERVTAYQRTYREDPERYERALKANRDTKRLARRLRTAGLPPKQTRHTPAGERRTNEREANHFFTSTAVRTHYRQYEAFEHALERHVWGHHEDLRRRARIHVEGRARAGLPPQSVDDAMFVHAVWDVVAKGVECDTLDDADVARAVAYTRDTHTARRKEWRIDRIIGTVARYARTHVDELRQDAAVENRARVRVGKPPVRVDVLAHRIAFEAVKDKFDLTDLTVRDVGKALNLAREMHLTLFDAPAGSVARPWQSVSTISR